jgi:RimJ/RimL family protein N-acetyltransferase/broad specificity phosphatase PhoE
VGATESETVGESERDVFARRVALEFDGSLVWARAKLGTVSGLVRYVSHPEVRIDPALPVPEWGLSDRGRERTYAMLRQPWIASISRIVSSTETKAIETASIVAAHLGLSVEARALLGENDRSATGFVPPDRFEQLANQFFAHPDESVEGWETARHAQSRVVEACADLFGNDDGDVLMVGHGGVGTLLYCACAGLAIDRRLDQRGGGNMFTIDRVSRVALHPWVTIDPWDRPTTPAVTAGSVERDGRAVVAFTTDRLVARRLSLSDRGWLGAFHTDAEVMATIGGVRTSAQSMAWLDENLAGWDANGFGQWVLCRRDATQNPVGKGGLRMIAPEVGEQLVEIGYSFERSAWGHGFASEAAAAFVEIARTEYGLNELGAITLTTNFGSQKVLVRAGFVAERIVMLDSGPHAFFRWRLPV